MSLPEERVEGLCLNHLLKPAIAGEDDDAIKVTGRNKPQHSVCVTESQEPLTLCARWNFGSWHWLTSLTWARLPRRNSNGEETKLLVFLQAGVTKTSKITSFDCRLYIIRSPATSLSL